MKLVLLSDTHSMHEDVSVPLGDVLIHAGDLTFEGSNAEIFDVFAWLNQQPHKNIVVVPGNHDFGFQRVPTLRQILKSKFPRIRVLIDKGAVIDGIRFYGSPWQPWFHDWAFNFAQGPEGGKQAEQTWASVPNNTQVLITHGPPYGILDRTRRGERVGCPVLKARIEQLTALRLHVFGHIHESYGLETHGTTIFANATICDEVFLASRAPHVIELL